jgi:hypothetical protein
MVFDSSCPRLSRASTFQIASQIQDVDGRDKPGHDDEESQRPRMSMLEVAADARPACQALENTGS